MVDWFCMIYPKKRNIHRPAHIYLDGEIYFVSCRTFRGKSYFRGNSKDFIVSSVRLAKEKYNFKLFAWAILDNHYHLLLEVAKGDDLFKVVRFINGRSARLLNKLLDAPSGLLDAPSGCVIKSGTSGVYKITKPEASSCRIAGPEASSCRRVWYQYREKIVRGEKDFYAYFNYIHHNPVKHGLIKNFGELKKYPFCSYGFWLGKMGRKWLEEVTGQSRFV